MFHSTHRHRLVKLVKIASTSAFALGALVSLAASSAAYPPPFGYGPYNPTVYDSGPYFGGVVFDPWGNLIQQTNGTTVKQIALDPFRNQIDPGSLQFVNETRFDAFGRPYRVTGWRWTSFGVPHSTLTNSQTVPTGTPGVGHQHNQTVLRMRKP